MRSLLTLAAFALSPLAVFAQPPKAGPPAAPPQKAVDPNAVPPDLADWTPRPAVGKATPWERATDKDWTDGRFRLTDTGPFLDATCTYPVAFGGQTPHQVPVYKGLAIRLGGPKGAGGVLFDRNAVRAVAGWTGGWVQHSDRRFGLLNTPTPIGTFAFADPVSPAPGWAGGYGQFFDVSGPKDPYTGVNRPLPAGWAKYRGLYVHGDRVVLKYTVHDAEVLAAYRLREGNGPPAIVETLRVGPTDAPLKRAPFGRTGPAVMPASKTPQTFVSVDTRPATNVPPDDLDSLTKPGPARWGRPLVTKLARGGDGGPLAVDTLTLPYDNPFKALFFCTGVDFLPDGRVAVCTCHGDVWLATVDEAAGAVAWQRFATGLYHPLGLKVVDGKVVVLERGQLTRLHDHNGDGEADFYECVNNDWDTGPGEHSYDTCLETDPQGNFYFFKTGDTHLPTGGCLMRVSKDGAKAEVFATGFRHPIGLGASPTGVVTGADQEGNWMPATRIDQYKPGGFYGDFRAHHRATPPTTYDGPLCWLPREVDNSAGGQVWVPDGKFGPLGGLPLHLSYGRCKAFVLLRQEYPRGVQGGVWDLGLTFLSGVCRGRFGPDGNLYVCGLNGWQTAAQADGCVQRVRPTGKPLHAPVKLAVVPDGVNLTFGTKLDKAAAEDPARYRAAWWNYRWSGDYGSPRFSVASPGTVGQDDVPVTKATLLDDGRTVHVTVARGMQPVMQMQVGVNLKAADGAAVVGSVYLTVHDIGK